MKTPTLFILALCVLVLPFNSRAGVTDAQRADYVQKTWGLASDGSDAAQYFADKLNIQYNGIPFKDYVTGLVTANQLAAQLENKDYYDAARTATGYATDLTLAAIYQELKISGEVGVVSFSSSMIGFSLDYFVWVLQQNTFNEQCRFYFVAREQLRLPFEQITNHISRDDILFSDDGWIYTLPNQLLSWRAGRPFFANSTDFYVVAEKLYLQHKNQEALQADSQQIGQAFRQGLQPAGPTFTTDLSNQTITDGQTAVFSVVVTGTGPFQYVWSVNGSALSGPYGSSFTATEAGTYQVTVYDANQLPAVSRLATLTVNPASAPVVLGSPTSGATVSGTFNVRASAPGATKVVFSLDGNPRYTDATVPFTWAWDTTSASDGAHQLLVTAYNGTTVLGSTAARTITVNNASSGDCNDPNEPNNTSLTGTWLPLGTNINGYICTPTDVDWFRIPVTTAGVISVSLTVPAGLDFDLELYGPNSTWKAGSYHGPGISENISLTNSTTGIYYARVYGYPVGNGSHSTTNAYTIAASQTSIPLSTLSNGQVAYYPFDGNANDASGNNNNGIIYGASLTSDCFGNPNSAYQLNGTGAWIGASGTAALNLTNDFSIALWAKPNWPASQANYLALVSFSQGFADQYFLGFLPNRRLYFTYLYGGTTQDHPDTSGIIFNNNIWYHICVVIRKNLNTVEFYSNGSLLSSVSCNFSQAPILPVVNASLQIGLNSGENYFFAGGVDQLHIYNRAISAAEIQQLFSQESTFQQPNLSGGLVAHYPLAGNANDASGNGNNGIVFGATLTTNRFGDANAAYDFNGSSSYIDVPQSSSLDLTTNFTLSAWIYQRAVQPNYGYRILDKCPAGIPDGWTFDTWDGVTGRKLRLQAIVPNSYNVTGTTIYSLMQWHHVVASVSGTVGKVYLDGNLDGTGNVGNIPKNTLDIFIGCAHPNNGAGATEWFNGIIDDVRIYNRTLSDAEVLQLYNNSSGQQVSETLSIISQPASHNSSLGDNTTFSVLAVSSSALSYQWQRNGTDIPGATNINYVTPALTFADNGANYLVRITDASSSAFSAPATLVITVPRLANPAISNDGSFHFDVITDDTRAHTIEVSTNLVSWLPLTTNSATGGVIHISDTATSNQGQRFYRAVVQ